MVAFYIKIIVGLLTYLTCAFTTQSNTYQAPFENERIAFYATLECKPWTNSTKNVITDLQKEESALHTEFLNIVGMTEEEWLQLKYAVSQSVEYKNYMQKKASDAPQVNKECEKAVRDQLEKIGLNISSIEFCGCSKENLDKFCPTKESRLMYVTQTQFFISDTWQPLLGTDRFNFTVGHEVQHLMHDDYFNSTCMKTACVNTSNNIDPKKIEDLLKKYSHFVEKRADMLSCLIDITHVQSYYDFLKPKIDYLTTMGDLQIYDQETDTHPSAKTSFDYTTMVYNGMTTNNRVVA